MSEKQTQTGAFRKKKIKFAQVSNIALRDDKLSLKAKGLYALIQSYVTLEDFTLYKTTLKKQCVEKEKAFESTWAELKDAGYLIQYRFQDDQGKYYYEYDLLDEPNQELALEIHSKQNRKRHEDKTHNPKKEGMDKIESNHTPKKDDMDKGCYGKGGVYNNTDSIYIDLNNTNINNTTVSKKIETKVSVVTQQESIILEETNINELTAHQKKNVAKWDIATLIRAIQIYKDINGQYFKLLDKIYKDGAKVSLTSGSKKQDASEGMYTHEWDFDNLEKLQREHIQKKLKESGTELPA